MWLLGGQMSAGREEPATAHYRDVWNTRDGLKWTKVLDDAPWSDGCALVFRERIWVIGDGSAWNSSDGRTWTRLANNLAFLQRSSNGCAVFDGRIWIYGGMREGKMRNDVWNSTDGVRWQLVTEQAPWFPRGAEYSVVLNHKLWIYGGKTGAGYEEADDIWYMLVE